MFSQRIQNLAPSTTLALMARAKELQRQGKPIINLSVGEPDFDTPEHIKTAAIEAIKHGFTKYTAVDGIPELKQAVVNKLQSENNLGYDTDQVIVSAGAKLCIYNMIQATLNPEDEVLIPAPYWVSYPDIALICGAKPVILHTSITSNFKITPEQLDSACNANTRMIILNSPSNPTGAVYTIQELTAIAEVLLKHPQILIISDDIYEHIMWQKPFVNILNACPDLAERTVIINGVSKAYAMTGWRIGYAAGPKIIIRLMKTLQSQNLSCPDNIAQHAATAALSGPKQCVIDMTMAFKQRHDYLIPAINAIPGMHCVPSQGAFYCFANVEKLIEKFKLSSDSEFTEMLLNKTEVVCVPGSAFGAPGHVRISFATSLDNLKQAIQRLRKLLLA